MAVDRLHKRRCPELTPLYQKGQLSELRVRAEISRRYNLPTSLTNIRQMWLEVTAKDEKGKIIMASGALDKDGSLPGNSRVFNSDGMGKDFHFSLDPWVITAFSGTTPFLPAATRTFSTE